MRGKMIELESIWQDYGLDKLEEGMGRLFPDVSFSLSDLMERVMSGDVLGAIGYLFQDEKYIRVAFGAGNCVCANGSFCGGV